MEFSCKHNLETFTLPLLVFDYLNKGTVKLMLRSQKMVSLVLASAPVRAHARSEGCDSPTLEVHTYTYAHKMKQMFLTLVAVIVYKVSNENTCSKPR